MNTGISSFVRKRKKKENREKIFIQYESIKDINWR